MPIYLQLKRLLEDQVANGTLQPHSRIPSERELSEQFDISRMTARRALLELTREGRIYTAVGKGTFVAEPKISQNLQALTSFSEDMRARGLRPATRLLRRERIPAPLLVAESLRLPPETPVISIARLRLVDDEPLALEFAHFSFPEMDALLALPLEGSLYELLRERFQLIPSEAIQAFEARLAVDDELPLLKIVPGTPVLTLDRTTFDPAMRPFEYVQSVYRSDRYRFVARLVREVER
ncbi:MAG TPA: GntR family transcriptional regulator [Chloroflexaceae bacterium]|nr:GntR family transcriptional regulator [Chloroflexaceae bacterium]